MRIGFIGSSCCGKSTLVDAFHERHLHFEKIKEIASNFTEEERNVFEFQRKIMLLQIEAEYKIKRDMISDRTIIDNLAYCYWHYRNHNFNDTFILNDCLRIFDLHMKTKPYDYIFFVDEYFPLEDNGIRNLNPEQQRDIFNLLHGLTVVYGDIYNIPIIKITGSTKERIKEIESWIG